MVIEGRVFHRRVDEDDTLTFIVNYYDGADSKVKLCVSHKIQGIKDDGASGDAELERRIRERITELEVQLPPGPNKQKKPKKTKIKKGDKIKKP